MLVLQNKETGALVDPRSEDFALSPNDVLPGCDSWDNALAQHSETDIVDGFAVVEGTWVDADDEFNADGFWFAFRQAFPNTAANVASGRTLLSTQLWEKIQSLPGFSDGPPHARNAIVSGFSAARGSPARLL